MTELIARDHVLNDHRAKMSDMRAVLPWLTTMLLLSACGNQDKAADLGVDLNVASVELGADECGAAGGTCIAAGADCEVAGMPGSAAVLTGCPSACCLPAPLCTFASCEVGVGCPCPVVGARCDLPSEGVCTCAPGSQGADGGSGPIWDCPIL